MASMPGGGPSPCQKVAFLYGFEACLKSESTIAWVAIQELVN